MRKNYRGGRIGEEIKRIIGEMLLRELKDPRFSGFVSVSAVKAADDGTFATVYITMLGQNAGDEAAEAEKREVLRAFESAKGLIRKEIGTRLQLRHTPDLRFLFDTSEQYGRHIEQILGELKVSSGSPEAGESEREAEIGEADESATSGNKKDAAQKENDSIEVLADVLLSAGRILLFTHESMDGDTLGSAVGLCLALRQLGKDCSVVVDEKIPDNIAFIEYGCCVSPEGLAPADVSMLLDVDNPERLGGRTELFLAGTQSMCIDHHISSKRTFDFNYIETTAAATAEIIYELILALGAELDTAIAEAIYVAIVTDTGRFQYDSTSEYTHRITAELIKQGVSPAKVSDEIYHSLRIEKMFLENAVMATMRSVADGKGVVTYLTQQMLTDTGAIEEETEGIAEKLRSIRGVEVSAFVRETENGRTKGSMRSKSYYDVAALAGHFGGGGHVRAAGFTIDKPLADVVAELSEILETTL